MSGYRVEAFAGSSGGSALTIGSAAYWSGSSSPITVTGTDDGTAYHFEVKADNTVADVLSGLGTASVRESGTAYRAPDAPTGVYGVSGDSSVAVTWVAPDDTGGAGVALTH